MAQRLSHGLRADAQDNRERILAAARTVFANDGFGAPMRAVAERAGVSPATVYRRFPTKEALARELYLDQSQACHAIIDEGATDPDPWRGFCLVIEKIFDLHARDRGFTAAFAAAYPDALDYAGERTSALRSVAELARRAKASGALRPDFVVNDLVLVMMAHRGLRTGPPAARLAASQRFAALTIQGFRTA